MKERRTLKEVYSQHKDAILNAVFVIAVIASFICGYLLWWNFMAKPLNDSQFELCEQVARDVYAQKGTVIVEVPEDFYVTITETTIRVELLNCSYRGKVIAKLQNGELVMTRDMQTEEAVFFSILVGIVFGLVTILIAIYIKENYQITKSRKK